MRMIANNWKNMEAAGDTRSGMEVWELADGSRVLFLNNHAVAAVVRRVVAGYTHWTPVRTMGKRTPAEKRQTTRFLGSPANKLMPPEYFTALVDRDGAAEEEVSTNG